MYKNEKWVKKCFLLEYWNKCSFIYGYVFICLCVDSRDIVTQLDLENMCTKTVSYASWHCYFPLLCAGCVLRTRLCCSRPSLRSRGGGTTIGFNIDIFARFGGGFSFPLPFRFLCFRTASDVISLSALFLWDCDSLRRSRLPNQWPPTAWGTQASDVPRCDCRTERSVVVGCRTVAVYGMMDAS